jgi:hypothetical protein
VLENTNGKMMKFILFSKKNSEIYLSCPYIDLLSSLICLDCRYSREELILLQQGKCMDVGRPDIPKVSLRPICIGPVLKKMFKLATFV